MHVTAVYDQQAVVPHTSVQICPHENAIAF